MNIKQRQLDEELAKQGWERRTVLSQPRLSEVIDEYKELGFEVHLEPVRYGDPDTGCDVCFDSPDSIQIVYTRKKK